MNVAVVLLSVVVVGAGIALVLAGRRQRLNRAARGEEAGSNIVAVIGISMIAVGLLNLVRAF